MIQPDGKETGLGAHVPQVSSVESVGQFDDGFIVDVAMLRDGVAVDLEDLHPGLLVGKRDLYLPVQPAGSEEGGVEGVGSVGGHDDLHLPQHVEPVHLVEQL